MTVSLPYGEQREKETHTHTHRRKGDQMWLREEGERSEKDEQGIWTHWSVGAGHGEHTQLVHKHQGVLCGMLQDGRRLTQLHKERALTCTRDSIHIGWFSEAGLHEWLPFVIFCAGSCERLQLSLLGQFLSRRCFTLRITMKVEPRIVKQYNYYEL